MRFCYLRPINIFAVHFAIYIKGSYINKVSSIAYKEDFKQVAKRLDSHFVLFRDNFDC